MNNLKTYLDILKEPFQNTLYPLFFAYREICTVSTYEYAHHFKWVKMEKHYKDIIASDIRR